MLSLQDPGVPNWIDPAGIPTGMCILRYYKSAEAPVPAVKRVALAEVRDHLPAATPVVTPEQRAKALIERRDAVYRRYGH